MKKLLLFAGILLSMMPMRAVADDALLQQDLFSNYGGWVNLTAGYVRDTTDANPIKSEVAVSGNTVHVVFADVESNNHDQPEGYAVWYRRSTDGGATWQDAKSLYQRRSDKWDGLSNMMVVDGQHVHVLVPDEGSTPVNPMLVYLHSTDGGATFNTLYLDTLKQSYHHIQEIIIRAEGANVVIAARYDIYQDERLVLYRSTDYGSTFRHIDLEKPQSVTCLCDLQLKGDKWAMLWYHQWYYSTLNDGRVYVTTGNMTSDAVVHSQLAPNLAKQGEEDKYRCVISKQYGGNGDDYNFHPMMAITENETIHVMFNGENQVTEGEDISWNRTLYARSKDFGATWSAPVRIPDAGNYGFTLVAKGQNVYAVVGTGYQRWIAYSNDGGDTWKANKTMCYGSTHGTNYDSPRAYTLVLDPNDATGKHAWYLGAKWLDLETKDGFNTLSRCHRAEGDLGWVTSNRHSQFSPLLAIDGQGIRHLFMRQPVGDNRNVQQIFYRKEAGEPAPNGKTMALHMYESGGGSEPTQRIAIPLNDSFVLDSALSYGCWVRVDRFGGGQLLSYRQNTPNTSGEYQEASYYAPGFYLTFDNPYRKDRMYFEAGITTDKAVDGQGKRVVHWEYYDSYAYMDRQPGYWHYVAFTWDGRQTENNAALYVDGFKVASATVPGALERGTNPLIIGNKNKNDNDWYMDELQIWNRALTQEEVEKLSRHQSVSDKGCIVKLGFDGTLKDLSGNGNDALAELNCEFAEYEGIQLPEPNMQVAKDITGRKITFTDQTKNGQAYYWFFNDYNNYYTTLGDTVRHPQHEYKPGEYEPVLIARGKNAYNSIRGHFTVGGLNKVEPRSAGQANNVRMKIYGGYSWSKGLNVRMHREGKEDIIGAWIKREGYNDANATASEKLHYAYFDLSQAELGAWDVIVGTDTLKQAFTVEKYEEPDVWANVTGWDKMLINRAKNFSIEYGNRANVDAYNVPFFLFVSDHAEVTLGFESPMYTDAMSTEIKKALKDSVGAYRVIDGGEYGQLRCYGFLIPRIPANSRNAQSFFVKTDKDVNLFYMISEPWGIYMLDKDGNVILADSDKGTSAPRRVRTDEIDDLIDGGGGIGGMGGAGFGGGSADCMIGYLGWGVLDATMSALPFAGCAWGIGKTVYQGFTDKPGDRWGNVFTNTLGTAFSCAMDFNPLGWGMRATTLASFAFNTAMNIKSVGDCPGGNGGGKKVKAVGSYDPNEMIGPSGFGDNHYMKPAPEMSYTVTFENKSTATAPAHEVFVYDTLDAKVYDFESFAFTSFGWADTIFSVDGQNMKEFVQDVKLSAEMTVRVSGQFDAEKGVAKWSFITLDKDLKLEEDPDKGFLVPNNANHEGEGFVMYGISHKVDLGSGTKIANEATIIFDANAPIKTNRYINTLDSERPESKVLSAIPDEDGKLVVTWQASDAASGVAAVDLYQSVNKGEYKLVEHYTDGATSAKLAFDKDKKYCFAVIAVDNVGWLEDKDAEKLSCEATYEPEDQAIDQITNDQLPITNKVIIDGNLYILHDGKIYTAQGQEIIVP